MAFTLITPSTQTPTGFSINASDLNQCLINYNIDFSHATIPSTLYQYNGSDICNNGFHPYQEIRPKLKFPMGYSTKIGNTTYDLSQIFVNYPISNNTNSSNTTVYFDGSGTYAIFISNGSTGSFTFNGDVSLNGYIVGGGGSGGGGYGGGGGGGETTIISNYVISRETVVSYTVGSGGVPGSGDVDGSGKVSSLNSSYSASGGERGTNSIGGKGGGGGGGNGTPIYSGTLIGVNGNNGGDGSNGGGGGGGMGTSESPYVGYGGLSSGGIIKLTTLTGESLISTISNFSGGVGGKYDNVSGFGFHTTPTPTNPGNGGSGTNGGSTGIDGALLLYFQV